MLKKYRRISSITDRRVETLKNLLSGQIERIKQHALNR